MVNPKRRNIGKPGGMKRTLGDFLALGGIRDSDSISSGCQSITEGPGPFEIIRQTQDLPPSTKKRRKLDPISDTLPQEARLIHVPEAIFKTKKIEKVDSSKVNQEIEVAAPQAKSDEKGINEDLTPQASTKDNTQLL